jgi:HlyD family secretion protein
MIKKILLVVVLAGVAVAGVMIYRSQNPPQSDRILASGNIELTQINIAFKTAGRLIELNVAEGHAVKKGMVVARLDKDQLIQQREAQIASLRTSEAQLAEARTSLDMQRQTLDADLDVRQSQVQSADSRLKDLKNGARPQELDQAKAAVESAEAESERATKDWTRAQTLYKDDDISTSQYDQFRTRFQSSGATLKQAKQALDLLSAGARTEVVHEADAQLSGAKASLKLGEANRLSLNKLQQEITAREADIDRSKAQIALLDAQIADTVAASPIDGVVLVKSADVGEVLAPGTSVVEVGDIDHPWLRAYVGEKDLGRVKLGGKVKVTTDSYPGKVYDGRISFISSEAEFTPKEIQTTEERVKLVFRIKIDIDNRNHELKSNMPADAEIVTGQ